MDRRADPFRVGAPLAILADGRAPCTTVFVRGELDLAAVAQLCACVDQVLTQGACEITLDLNGVTFLDAGGIGGLVHVRNQIASRGSGKLSVVCESRQPRDLLRLTGMETALDVLQSPAGQVHRPRL